MISQKKILVIDDEDMILTMVSEILGEEGYWVVTAKHPSLAPIHALDADLVILDLKLSDQNQMDGVRVLSHLWEIDNNSVPVIIYSGHLNSSSVRDNLKIALQDADRDKRIYDYVEKGQGIKKLIDAVDSYFSKGLQKKSTNCLQVL